MAGVQVQVWTGLLNCVTLVVAVGLDPTTSSAAGSVLSLDVQLAASVGAPSSATGAESRSTTKRQVSTAEMLVKVHGKSTGTSGATLECQGKANAQGFFPRVSGSQRGTGVFPQHENGSGQDSGEGSSSHPNAGHPLGGSGSNVSNGTDADDDDDTSMPQSGLRVDHVRQIVESVSASGWCVLFH